VPFLFLPAEEICLGQRIQAFDNFPQVGKYAGWKLSCTHARAMKVERP